MAFDEYLFGKVSNFLRNRKKASAEAEQRKIYLESIRPRLLVLARAITGEAIEIFPAEREGGFKGLNFFLPVSFSLLPTQDQNLSFYFFRIVYLSVQRKLFLNGYGEQEITDQEAYEKAKQCSGQVLEKMAEEYPIARELYDGFLQVLGNTSDPNQVTGTTWLYGKWMKDSLTAETPADLQNSNSDLAANRANKPTTTIQAKPAEEVKLIQVDKKQQEDYVLTHNFEKVETADEFSGVWRDFDGDDSLKDHADALDELNLKTVVRTDDVAHSVYQADFIENAGIAEVATDDTKTQFISYPEWNYAKQNYYPEHCKLFPRLQSEKDPDYYNRTISDHRSTLMMLRKLLTNVNNKKQQFRRQTQGNEFDIDAVTDLFVDVHSGKTPEEKVYLSSRKKLKDISILLLLDASLSSDSYAAGNRVIDVEKQVSILFGEMLHDFNIDFSINYFNSRTRNYTSYTTVKGFDENWDSAKYKIGAVQPNGYTRIGTALRHSASLLNARDARSKWLILISDGKPNDFDRYEGRYGISDVKQALREMHANDISYYALAIEKQARYYLPQMFGSNHYQILTTPVELLKSLARLYERIRYQTG
jgi:nitric oxide reductase NorD protein